jgi:hypothetical protein
MWRCDPARANRGLPYQAIALATASATATETVTFRAGGRVLERRVMQPGQRVNLPYVASLRQQLSIAQMTEPGTLKALVSVDFSPRPIAPHHCAAYLPPGLVVRLHPR